MLPEREECLASGWSLHCIAILLTLDQWECIPLSCQCVYILLCLIRQALPLAALLHAILLAVGHTGLYQAILGYARHTGLYQAYWAILQLGMLDTRAHLFVLLAATTDKFPY